MDNTNTNLVDITDMDDIDLNNLLGYQPTVAEILEAPLMRAICAACGQDYSLANGSYQARMQACRNHDEECAAIPPDFDPWNPEEDLGWDYWDLMAL